MSKRTMKMFIRNFAFILAILAGGNLIDGINKNEGDRRSFLRYTNQTSGNHCPSLFQ